MVALVVLLMKHRNQQSTMVTNFSCNTGPAFTPIVVYIFDIAQDQSYETTREVSHCGDLPEIYAKLKTVNFKTIIVFTLGNSIHMFSSMQIH